ncbi:MAG: hypothetical protein V3W34_01370 [Phycisphaerae bacterium]
MNRQSSIVNRQSSDSLASVPFTTRQHLAIGMSLVLSCCGFACRENSEPPGRHNVNLGGGARLLLPTPLRRPDEASFRGKASVVPLVDLDAGSQEAPGSQEADRRAIVRLFAAVRSAIAEQDLEAMVDLLVERQREVARAAIPATRQTLQVLVELTALLQSAAAPAFADTLVEFLSDRLNPTMEMGELTFESPEKASAVFGMHRLEFEKSGGRWFFVSPVFN